MAERMWGRSPRDRELLVDAMLMVPLASGPLDRNQLDALQFVLSDPGALGGYDWSLLSDRAQQLAYDAPLFFDIRPKLVEELKDPLGAGAALETGARIAAVGGRSDDSTRALFVTLSEGLGVDDASWRWERAQATAASAPRFQRAVFNDPLGPQPADLYDAIAEAEDAERPVLWFKLHAIRDLFDHHLEPPRRLRRVGTLHDVGRYRLRIDAEIDQTGAHVYVRAIAPGEALFPEEHPALKAFVLDHLDPKDAVVLAHAEPLSVADASLLATFEETQLRAVQVPRYPDQPSLRHSSGGG